MDNDRVGRALTESLVVIPEKVPAWDEIPTLSNGASMFTKPDLLP